MKEKHLWKIASLLIAVLVGLAMVMSCSKDDGDGNGGSSSGDLQKYVGTWEIVYSNGYRIENGEVVSQWNEDVSSEHNRIVFGADGTWTFYEYSSSRGAWHEDGKGTYYLRDDQIVVTGAMDNFKLISLSSNEMVIEYEFNEQKGSTLVNKHYCDTLRRITPSSSDIYESGSNSSSNSDNGGNSSSGSGGSSSEGGSSNYYDDDNGGLPAGAKECYSCHGTCICTTCNGTGKSTKYSGNCILCSGTGVCFFCDGRGYYFPVNGGNSSGGSSSGGSSGGSSSGGSNSTTRTCAVCGGSGKCMSTSYDKYHCRGTGTCQTCSGKGWYYGFSYERIMCPNCDVAGHGNTPGNGKCSFCGGSGQCKYCKGKGYK
ncbi:MAG: hypothetical protein J5888_04305 [Bacteroidaceae bacterium]|nr:hypothetical protein [Bacteroidaceae bacterium]